jgi:ParB family transcriptional regulator, chromosome partitioning protein
MVTRRDERISRLALGSSNPGGRLKSGDDAPQLVEAIPVAAIDPDPEQPRRHFDPVGLQELADSLRSVGQLQPIIVIRQGERYQLHIGERRWRASQLAGLPTIRAIVRSTPLGARASRLAQIIENDQRADLTVTEMVDAVRALRGDGMRSVEIAAALARPKSRVSELSALARAPSELLAIIDRIGLALAYQLFGQWRAQPDAALDFLRHMPVEHISRITIATIGRSIGTPESTGGETAAVARMGRPAADDAPDRTGMGKGAPPPIPADTPSAPLPRSHGSGRSSPEPDPATPDMIGALLVEHAEYGSGSVIFGADAPPDHLAIRFAEAAPIVLHKADVRLVRTVPSGGGPA